MLRPIYRALPILVFLFLIGSTAGAASLPALTRPPLGDEWYLILLNNEKSGFLHLHTEKSGDGYTFTSESSVKITVLGFSREAASRETYTVNRDLTLKSFVVEETLDRSPMTLEGAATPQGIKVVVKKAGERNEKLLRSKAPVYPSAAINLYPLMHGFAPGKTYKFSYLDVESVKVKPVAVSAIGIEREGNSDTLHMQNNLYSFVDNDIWTDTAGTTLRESVRDDMVVTRRESEQSVKAFMAEGAVNGKDFILDYSMVKPDRPLKAPRGLKTLVLEISGVPAGLALPAGPRQKVERAGNGTEIVTSGDLPWQREELSSSDRSKYLEPSDRIPVNQEIAARAAKIVGDEKDPVARIKKLATWTAREIEGAVTDTLSPMETLKVKKGNCQAHARLYTALARAAGIPTRFVSGLMYAEGNGFLYHSWAESFADGHWMAVDPTFGQIPSDATHIKLAEGAEPDDMAPMAGMIGRIGIKVVEERR